MDKQQKTFVIMQSKLIKQWQDELEYTTLDYITFSHISDIYNEQKRQKLISGEF